MIVITAVSSSQNVNDRNDDSFPQQFLSNVKLGLCLALSFTKWWKWKTEYTVTSMYMVLGLQIVFSTGKLFWNEMKKSNKKKVTKTPQYSDWETIKKTT